MGRKSKAQKALEHEEEYMRLWSEFAEKWRTMEDRTAEEVAAAYLIMRNELGVCAHTKSTLNWIIEQIDLEELDDFIRIIAAGAK